ncbi:MAG: ATP-binding protein, partial [Cyanobacteria bacterium P01_H01_bin.15]
RETSFELLHLSQTLQTLFQQKIEQKDLRFAIEIAPETPLTLVGDEQKIAQVLINLLANAIKFTPEGSILLNISGELLPHQQIVSMRFEVIDTGVGIASEELSKLFVPFEQTQSGLHANSGTGLGLSISKHFVELMKGHIEVSSTLGQGATFTVSLDLACPEEAALSESLSLQESKHKDLSNGAVLGIETITQTLALMDQAWLQDLQEAASRLKSRQVQSLLAMMPEEAENVEKYLQNLAQNYDYTRLASLAATVMDQKDV